MEQHLLHPGPLLDNNGNLVECGYSCSLVKEYSRKAIKANRLRIKEWDYYYIGNKERGLALTIDDNSYMNLVSATVFDFRYPSYLEHSVMGLMSLGKGNLPSTSAKDDTIFSNKKVMMKFLHEGDKRHIIVLWKGFGKKGEELKADVYLEETTGGNSMVIATPFDKKAHFYYNQKINNQKASGYAKLGDEYLDFNKDTYAVLDWGRGVWTYRNTWYWSSASFAQDGHTIGWNLGYGFGNTKAASENMLFVDTKAYKLDDVQFIITTNKHGKDDFISPWKMVSKKGDINLIFTPVIVRHGGGNALVLNSIQNQTFGHFSGRFVVDNGQKIIEIKDAPGFAEKVYNRWQIMNKRGEKLFGTYSGNKVPRLTEGIYSFSGIFRDACTTLVSGFFLTFAKTAGLLGKGSEYISQLSVITTILALLLIWDGFNDPIMAIIIEKCHFKTGKYRPWILIGAIGNTLMVLLMFLTKPTGWFFVVMFGLYYFLWDFAFTMNDIAYWSMLPSLTNEGKERNKLTTLVTISATLGNIAMNVIVVLCQGDGSHNYEVFGKIAVPAASLFLISQIAVFFFCKEHVRDPKQEQISSRTKFSDLFSIMQRNKPLRMSILSIFFYYLLSAVLMGFGFDFFYFTYSSIDLGGDMAVYFLVVYVVGCLLAQALYPSLAKRFSKKTLLAFAFYLSMIAFALFFFLGLPIFGDTPLSYSAPTTVNGKLIINPFLGTGWIIFIPVFLFSMGIGIYYLVQLVLFQDSIDYNEWKFGERKEAVACAWRPISSKVSSALEKGIYNIAIVSTGLDLTFSLINDANQEVEADLMDPADASSVISNALASVSSFTKISFTIWMGVSIFVCLIVSYLCLRFGYKVSEVDHQKMVIDLEKREQENIKNSLQNSEVKTDSSIPR